MSSLVDTDGNVLISGLMDDVKPLTEEEEKLYDSIDFSLDDYKEETTVSAIGVNKSLRNDKKSLLMARWRYPSLSLHGIESAFSDCHSV